MSGHLTQAERDAVTDEMVARAIVAHAKRAGLTVLEWIDRELAKDEAAGE